MAYEKDPNELGALWVKQSPRGGDYMTGTIEGIGAVVCFRTKTTGNPKAPQWRVLKSKPKADSSMEEAPF